MNRTGPDERWRRVDLLLEEALDRPPEERLSFVREAARDDDELRTTLEELVQASEEATSFLETPISLNTRTWLEASGDLVEQMKCTRPLDPGEIVGAWRIVGELGRGGMARVYLAERAEGGFEQRAALKVLRSDLDADIVRRFRVERQILSDLSHPNIARLLDGGSTTDGKPYLVMEAVDGAPIIDWCDRRRLGTRERLRLFESVVAAVHYAHVRLIVHRDLKPSNILVTPEGRVKLLDFGIASLLDRDEDDGAGGRRLMMTPEYASPEQVRGDRITTSSDVYQLGLLLYRLIAGAAPYQVDTTSHDAIRRSILESDPPRPSAAAARASEGTAAARGTSSARLAAELRGDLDAVVLEAIQKRPEDRYASAADLAADLENYFARRPLAAVPAGRIYRTRKYFARNTWAVPTLVGAVALSLGYVGVQQAHQRQVEAERNVARAEAERAEAVSAFLVDVFRSADPWSSPDPDRGREIRVKDALELGAQRVRTELTDQPDIQVELLASIAEVYRNLDLPELSRPLIDEAIRLQEATGAPAHARAGLHLQLGRTLDDMGEKDEALISFEEGLALARDLQPPFDTVHAAALMHLGMYETGRDNYQRSEQLLLRADSILAGRPGTTERRAELYAWLGGQMYGKMDRPDDAVRAATTAVELRVGVHGEDHPLTAWSRVELADAQDDAGRNDDAIQEYERALSVLEVALGPGHDAALQARSNLAVTLEEVGRGEEAVRELRRIVELRTARGGIWHVQAGEAMQNLAAILRRTGQNDEAAELLTRSHRVFRTVLPPGHHLTAFPLLTRSSIELERSDYAAAVRSTRDALAILSGALGNEHSFTAMARCRLGRSLAGQGDLAEGERHLRAAAPVVAESGVLPQAYIDECVDALGSVLERTGRPAEAEALRTTLASPERAAPTP